MTKSAKISVTNLSENPLKLKRQRLAEITIECAKNKPIEINSVCSIKLRYKRNFKSFLQNRFDKEKLKTILIIMTEMKAKTLLKL